MNKKNNKNRNFKKFNNKNNNYRKQNYKIRIFTINKHDLVIHKICDIESEEDRALMKVLYDNGVVLSLKFNTIDEMRFWRRKLKRVIEKNAEKEERERNRLNNNKEKSF